MCVCSDEDRALGSDPGIPTDVDVVFQEAFLRCREHDWTVDLAPAPNRPEPCECVVHQIGGFVTLQPPFQMVDEPTELVRKVVCQGLPFHKATETADGLARRDADVPVICD